MTDLRLWVIIAYLILYCLKYITKTFNLKNRNHERSKKIILLDKGIYLFERSGITDITGIWRR